MRNKIVKVLRRESAQEFNSVGIDKLKQLFPSYPITLKRLLKFKKRQYKKGLPTSIKNDLCPGAIGL